MGVRNLKLGSVTKFLGYDGTTPPENVDPNTIVDGLNVVVTAQGTVSRLRSAATAGTSLIPAGNVISIHEYRKSTGTLVLFDVPDPANSNLVTTISTSGGAYTPIRTGQAANTRWRRVTMDDWSYGLNGTEFIKSNGTLGGHYLVGISKPAAAPVLNLPSVGGTFVAAAGVNFSYAYHNTTTGHTGQASAASNTRIISGANQTVNISIVASTQPGVDKVVIFMTEDGGDTRYLVVDASGDPILLANTTHAFDVFSAPVILDTTTPETVNNEPAPQDGTYAFTFDGRIFLSWGQYLRYSGRDQIFLGVPAETWPANNLIKLPINGERPISGIATPIGALILSGRESFLLTGTPTDKIGDGTSNITERITAQSWGIGTRSPYTLKNTPYGSCWLGDDKKLWIWPWSGSPVEMGYGLRRDLGAINDDDTSRKKIDADWMPSALEGGYYVMTAPVTGSADNGILYLIAIHRGKGTSDVEFTCSPPAVAEFQSLCYAFLSSLQNKLLGGFLGQMRYLLEFDVDGGDSQISTAHFSVIVGNDAGNYSYFHSLRFDYFCRDQQADPYRHRAEDIAVEVSDLEESTYATFTGSVTSNNVKALKLTPEGHSMYALVDRNGSRHRLRFRFLRPHDYYRQDILNLRAALSPKRRVI